MLQRLKRDNAIAEARKREERPRASATLASVGLHILFWVALVSALQVPHVVERLMSGNKREEFMPERVRYVGVGPAVAAREIPRTPSRPPQAPAQQEVGAPLTAPREVPSTLPEVQPGATPREPSPTGVPSGPLVGGRGNVRGVQPTFDDPRVWSPSTEIVTVPKSAEERLDSALVSSLAKFQDSVVANTYSPNKFERGDWTVERNGKKYGIDQSYIHLGRISIPTALLGLLPLGTQSNPQVMERQRQQLAMRAEIVEHAQISLNEEEFRRAVKAIRDRKERERKAILAEIRGGGSARKRTGVDSKPIVAPSERPPN